jgi:hypothetical protein
MFVVLLGIILMLALGGGIFISKSLSLLHLARLTSAHAPNRCHDNRWPALSWSSVRGRREPARVVR